MITPADRARHALWWYPKSWRAEFAEELGAMVEDSIRDHPFWPRRGIDIAVSGSLTRIRANARSRTTRTGATSSTTFRRSRHGHFALRRFGEATLTGLGATVFGAVLFGLSGAH